MLKGISPLISPDLLATLCRMGHGDEIILADAHFPGDSVNAHVLRADGIKIPQLLRAILPLLELDRYVQAPVLMMAVVPGDSHDQRLLADYRDALAQHASDIPEIAFLERFAFYQRAKSAFAVVMTGETTKYGNILLKKGVTPTTDEKNEHHDITKK